MEKGVGMGNLDATARIHLLHLRHRSAEMVMDGGTFEEALLNPFLLACLIIETLDDNREALLDDLSS